MKRIATLIIAWWPLIACAHPCPFDWNIQFTKSIEIHGATMADFAKQLNEAVEKETKGRVKKAFVFECKADTFTKVPQNSPFAPQMDALIQRYADVTAPLIKKGVIEYGTAPESREFPANFPVACMLARPTSAESKYEETKDGANLTLNHDFQCRAYKVSARFLEKVKEWESKKDWIPAGVQPVPYVFAELSGMKQVLSAFPDSAEFSVEESILDGVTLYIAEKRIVLAIETKEGHEKMIKALQEKHFLESQNPEGSGKNPQSSKP